jgi:hypothetical protein
MVPLIASACLALVTAPRGPARDALERACPAQVGLAAVFEREAGRARLPPAALVALFRRESSCSPWAVNARTESYGALQVKVDGSANPRRLPPAELLDPLTNVRLGAEHLARLLRLCGSLGGALTLFHGRKGAYHGRKRCDVDDYARRVLRLSARIARDPDS